MSQAGYAMIDRLLGPLARMTWPEPPVDRLLRAALLQDRMAAAAAWREYEDTADFDRLTAPELRLIGLLSKRLAAFAPDSPMRGRIGGIERAHWTRSQLIIAEVAGGLRALVAAGVSTLAIKGAGRAARGGDWARGHLLTRVDIVLRPDEMENAFDVLTGDGWRTGGPGTPLYRRARLSDLPGLAFARGQFGSLVIHRAAFRPPHTTTTEDTSIWQRSVHGGLAQVDVQLPSVTDAVAMALAGGKGDAEDGAERLTEVAIGIEAGVDWELFQYLADRRRLHALAAAGLRYAAERLERPVPDAVLRQLELGAVRRPIALFGAYAKPCRMFAAVHSVRLALAAARQGRYSGSCRRVVFPSPFPHGARLESGAGALEQRLPLPEREAAQAWKGTIDLAISVELPPLPRRVDFEVNSPIGHHVRLTALVRNKGRRSRLLRFRFPIRLSPVERTLVLIAADSRCIDTDADLGEKERYGARPFRLVDVRAIEARPR